MYWNTPPKPVTKLDYSDKLFHTKYICAVYDASVTSKQSANSDVFKPLFIANAYSCNNSSFIGIQSSLLLFPSVIKKNRKHEVDVTLASLEDVKKNFSIFSVWCVGSKEMEEVKCRRKRKIFKTEYACSIQILMYKYIDKFNTDIQIKVD